MSGVPTFKKPYYTPPTPYVSKGAPSAQQIESLAQKRQARMNPALYTGPAETPEEKSARRADLVENRGGRKRKTIKRSKRKARKTQKK